MKRLLAAILILVLASLACSFSPVTAPPSDFPTAPPTAQQAATPLPATALPTFTPIPDQAGLLPLATSALPPAASASPALTMEQIRNATLTLTGSDQMARTITFKDGKYELGSDPAQAGYVSIGMGEQIAFGDLNADGQPDAALTISENYGGTGVFVSVMAILNNNGQPNPVSIASLEDRAMINALKIDNGEILLDATVHGPNDPMCCPSQPSTRSYRLIDNSLVLSHLTSTTPAGSERIIQIDSPAIGAELNGPFVVKGTVSISPFENTLAYKVFKQGASEPFDQMGFTISADGLGGPGTFELTLDFSQKGITGPVRIEIYDSSPADGSTLALATLFIIAK